MTDHSLPLTRNLGLSEIASTARGLASHWLKRRRLYRLQQLDDYMLNDIGLLREEVEAALQQPLSIDPVQDLNRRARARRAGGARFSFR